MLYDESSSDSLDELLSLPDESVILLVPVLDELPELLESELLELELLEFELLELELLELELLELELLLVLDIFFNKEDPSYA